MFRQITRTFLLMLLAATSQAYDFRAIADQHVIPAYRHLAAQTAKLDEVAKGYCAAPSPPAMQRLQQSYRDSFIAWQGVQHVRFGPVQFLSREHRFALWPDKRGTVGKHVRILLEDPALLAADFDISGKSVAVQGFSALEVLLFAAAPPDESACRLAVAIGANLRAMADGLVADWSAGDDAYVHFFEVPGAANPIYESDAALAGQLLNSLHTELELIETQKIARPLGDSLDKARGQRAEGWRSSTSLSAVAANLQACHHLYRHAFAPALHGTPLQAQIEQAFVEAGATLDAIDLPLAQAVSDPDRRARVERLQAALSVIRQLLARDLAGALGLSLGFNSLDGD